MSWNVEINYYPPTQAGMILRDVWAVTATKGVRHLSWWQLDSATAEDIYSLVSSSADCTEEELVAKLQALGHRSTSWFSLEPRESTSP